MKSPSSGADFLPGDRRTERGNEADRCFRNFMNAPKKYFSWFLCGVNTKAIMDALFRLAA